jgi:hypothetical protein
MQEYQSAIAWKIYRGSFKLLIKLPTLNKEAMIFKCTSVRPEPWHSSAEGKFQSKLKREAGEKSI